MSIFTDKKSSLEAKGFVVQDDNTVLGLNGQPEAGMDAYGQVWFKDETIEAICNKVEEEATPEEALVAVDPVETELVRARNDKGHYIKDDPDTEVNEAWTTKVIKKLKPNKKKKKTKQVSPKKLQVDSKYAMADTDGDGIITDEEMDRHERWIRLENEDKLMDTQRIMAWLAMSVTIVAVIILFTPIVSAEKMESAASFLNTFIVAQLGVVVGFMGATALSKTKSK